MPDATCCCHVHPPALAHIWGDYVNALASLMWSQVRQHLRLLGIELKKGEINTKSKVKKRHRYSGQEEEKFCVKSSLEIKLKVWPILLRFYDFHSKEEITNKSSGKWSGGVCGVCVLITRNFPSSINEVGEKATGSDPLLSFSFRYWKVVIFE